MNLPTKVTDARGKFATSDYYKTGKVKTVTNRRGYANTTGYDKLWRVTKVTDPLLKTIETTYDKVGNVRTVKDKRGIIAETLYDDLYRPERKLKDGIRLATFQYDDANNLLAETDAENNRTEYSYTKRNQKEKATYADGSFETYGYDGNGNLKTETDEEGIVTTHAYDKENRQTRTERAGEETQKAYDVMGNLAATIQPKGNSRGYGYDLLNRLIRVTDDEFGINLVTRYEYDKNNNRIRTTDPRGNVVENQYDELTRKTAHIQKKASGDLTASYEYDEEGNQTKLTDAKGQISTYVYDELNRRTESHYTGLDIITGYDENNNAVSAATSGTSSDNTVNTYDNFDRLKTSTQRGTQISYSYDNNGNRLSVGTPTSTTSYTYDQRNRVKTATAGSDVTTFDYFKDGKKKSVIYPNSAKEEYAYYPTNRIQSVTSSANGTTVSRFDYNYDQNGNRLTQDEARGARTIETTYAYDTLDRLQSYTVIENGTSTTTAYTFDGYNRASEKVTTATTTTTKAYSYDETDWLTQTSDGTRTITYAYDNNGNTLSKTDSTDSDNPVIFAYDSRDKLTSASKGGTTLGQYSYNANGYRIRQNSSDRGNVEYLYDGTAVIEERNGNGLLAHYRYANKLYSLTTPQGNQYYHLDALGSTTDLTDDSGATKASYFLNPWGMIVDSIGESANRRVFTGKEQDTNTGLIYFGARYYDPDTARFTTQDTYLGEQGTPPSLHRYLYAYSNPTVFIDLEGYWSWKETWKVVKDPVGSALNYTSKGLDYLGRKVDQYVDNKRPGAIMTGVATTAKTALTVGKSIVDTPGDLVEQSREFVKDPLNPVKIPVFGPMGKGIGESYARAYEDPSLVNISTAIGNTAFGVGLALGGAEFARGAKVNGTYQAPKPAPGLTGEPISGEKSLDVGALDATGGKNIFSGHGGYEIGSGITAIPDGTSLTVYSKFGSTISDELGNMIETGANLSNVYSRTYGTGDRLPNYTLYPPEGLNIKGTPITVDSPTQLSDLLNPNMGECHWAACTHNPKSVNAEVMYDKSGIVDMNSYKYIKIYTK